MVVLAWEDDGSARIVDPDCAMGEAVWPRAALLDGYAGSVLLLRPTPLYDARSAEHGPLHSGHWFWGTLRKLWPVYGEVLLAAFLVNVFALAMPLFTMNVYNRVVPNRAVETLWVLAIGVAVVSLFDLLMRSLRAYFLDVAGKKFDVALSARLFEQVMGLRMEVKPRSVGAFANQLGEFESFREFITSATLTTVIDLPFALLFLGMIAWLGGPLVAVPLALMPLVVLYGWWAQRRLRGLVQQTLRLGAQKQATVVETLTGYETVRSIGAAGPIQRRWEQTIGAMARLGMRSRLLSSSVVNAAGLAVQLCSLGILVYGVHRVIAGDLSVGALIACVMLAGRALSPLAQVAGLLVRFDQSVAALRSVDQIMQLPVERPAERNFLHRPALGGAIEFSNVSFVYPDQQVPALDNVSLRIAPGERVAVIGRIGSGKSTLEKLILGLYQPTAGAVLLDGVNNNDEFTGSVGQSVPLDAVQEFRLETNAFSAEFGRSAAQVNATTLAQASTRRATTHESRMTQTWAIAAPARSGMHQGGGCFRRAYLLRSFTRQGKEREERWSVGHSSGTGVHQPWRRGAIERHGHAASACPRNRAEGGQCRVGRLPQARLSGGGGGG